MNMLSLSKAVIPPVILNVLRSIRLKLKKYHGQWKIDERIEKYLNFDGGYYVELGAVDGIGLSNTLYFERNRKWSGLLVEPVPHNFLKCIANRSAEKNKIFCNACVGFDYKEQFVEMIYSHYMSTAIGLDSDIANPHAHAESGKNYLGSTDEKIFKFGAAAATLNHLLISAHAPQVIDFLSLDVEGAELEVLKGIDHATYKFKIMCVESRDPARITNYLSNFDYKYLEQISPHDYLYILNEYKEVLLKEKKVLLPIP
jgi:FkbM family methyltransferase